MRRYLLDTAPLAALLHGRQGAVALITPWIARHEVTTSILVYAEVMEYLQGRSGLPEYHAVLRTLLREIYPYFLTFPVLERYAQIRRELRPPHGPGLIGDIDTLIAATALERSLTLVTTDTDFQRVPGLEAKILARDQFR
ncbi:MAG TPA: type II toxin-antitoxin system VapC family toxin [Chloroflexota bacterium]|nr:type II toxin-antitoxin system VapC family toxin [Chloroflexota bacterium]